MKRWEGVGGRRWEGGVRRGGGRDESTSADLKLILQSSPSFRGTEAVPGHPRSRSNGGAPPPLLKGGAIGGGGGPLISGSGSGLGATVEASEV